MCSENIEARVALKILKNSEIAENIFELVLGTDGYSRVVPGQFVNIYCRDTAKLLPRPISICEVNEEEKTLKLVYAAVGAGTKEISSYQVGESMDVLGPLGNGYTLKAVSKSILVGGGVGTPPLVELAKQLEGEIEIYLGFRSEPYLVEELRKYGQVYVATDDGSVGHKGNVVELMNQEKASGDVLYACGPKPMLMGLQGWAKENDIEAWISLEERMGCGFGACVGCVCKVVADNEVGYTNKKVCKDGPVFNAKEVIL